MLRKYILAGFLYERENPKRGLLLSVLGFPLFFAATLLGPLTGLVIADHGEAIGSGALQGLGYSLMIFLMFGFFWLSASAMFWIFANYALMQEAGTDPRILSRYLLAGLLFDTEDPKRGYRRSLWAMALSFLGFLPLSVLGLVIRGKALKADIPWVETLGHGAYIDLAILPMWIASGALYWVFVNRSQLREASRG